MPNSKSKCPPIFVHTFTPLISHDEVNNVVFSKVYPDKYLYLVLI